MENAVDKARSVKKDRSAAYPAIPLEKAIAGIGGVAKNLGETGLYSREAVAEALGFRGLSGASASAVAALVHFGFLDRVGNSYRMSTLSQRILHPVGEGESKQATAEALSNPRLFSDLLRKYQGQPIPTMLPNILTREHAITANSSERVASIFRESCSFAGALQNGILTPPSTVASSVADIADTPHTHASQAQMRQPETRNSEIPLHAGVRLMVPAKLMAAFALGEFAEVLKPLQEKLSAWEATGRESTDE